MNPRIIIGVGDLLGCGYYRCVLPYKALAKKGFDVRLVNLLNPNITKDFEVLVLQRQHSKGVLANAEAYRTERPDGKVVFEFDDNLHAIPHSNPSSRVYRNGLETLKNMETLIRMSDMVTVSTPTLKREYSRYNDNSHVCFNSVDPDGIAIADATEVTEVRKPDTIRIGWAGSATHLDDFNKIVNPLSAVMLEDPRIRFVFVGADMRGLFPAILRSRLEHFGDTFPKDKNGNGISYAEKGSPTVDYYGLLKRAQFDIAIAPIESYLFNSCKSYIKLIEYGIAGIPFVASNFGPYGDYVRGSQAKVGLLAGSDSEWKKHLKSLVASVELRSSLSEANRQYVEEKHTIETKVDQWLTAYASLGIFPGPNPGHYEEKIEKTSQVAY